VEEGVVVGARGEDDAKKRGRERASMKGREEDGERNTGGAR